MTAGDRVILLSPEQPEPSAQERTQQAVRDVKETLSGVVRQLEFEHLKLPATDFMQTTDQISQVLVDGEPPVVCLGAGATDVMFPTLLAVMAHYEYVRDLMMFSDIERGGVSPPIPNLMARVPGRTMDVFSVLAEQSDESPTTISTLAEEAGRSVSTASRHIDALASEGLVEKHRCERSKTVSLTVTGRLFARNLLHKEG